MAKLHVEAIFERLPISLKVNLLRNCLLHSPQFKSKLLFTHLQNDSALSGRTLQRS